MADDGLLSLVPQRQASALLGLGVSPRERFLQNAATARQTAAQLQAQADPSIFSAWAKYMADHPIPPEDLHRMATQSAMGFMPMGFAGITKAWRMPIESGRVPYTRIIENPTKAELDAFLASTKHKAVRMLRVKSGKTWAVDGYDATHQMLIDHLGIDPADVTEEGTGLYLGD